MESWNVCLINDSFPPAIDGVANAVVNYGTAIAGRHGRATVVTPYYPQADDSGFPFPVVRYPSIDLTKLVGYRAGMPFHFEMLRQLEGEGFVYSIPGKGSFAAPISQVEDSRIETLLRTFTAAGRELLQLGVPKEDLIAKLEVNEF